jgi:septal ring factor EnvC (AmiA/AmiB activator)
VARPALALALVLGFPGCHSMSEEQALQAAREEVRREMQPEIERRQKEIDELKQQIEEARARLASRKAREAAAPSR